MELLLKRLSLSPFKGGSHYLSTLGSHSFVQASSFSTLPTFSSGGSWKKGKWGYVLLLHLAGKRIRLGHSFVLPPQLDIPISAHKTNGSLARGLCFPPTNCVKKVVFPEDEKNHPHEPEQKDPGRAAEFRRAFSLSGGFSFPGRGEREMPMFGCQAGLPTSHAARRHDKGGSTN